MNHLLLHVLVRVNPPPPVLVDLLVPLLVLLVPLDVHLPLQLVLLLHKPKQDWLIERQLRKNPRNLHKMADNLREMCEELESALLFFVPCTTGFLKLQTTIFVIFDQKICHTWFWAFSNIFYNGFTLHPSCWRARRQLPRQQVYFQFNPYFSQPESFFGES